MDSLTHVAMGMAIGQLTLGNKIGKKALVVGALIANLPDIDGLFQYFFSPAASTLFHRGISHSLILLLLLAPLLAYGINKFFVSKGSEPLFKRWYILVSTAWLSHLCLDVFNSYGTGLFEPFSNMRIAYDSIGITDFFFLFPLVIAAIMSLILKNTSKLASVAAAVALTISFGYLGYTINNKQSVERFAKAELERQNIAYTRILSSPLPITNLAWTLVVEDENGFWKGTYSKTTEKEIKFDYIPKNHHLAEKIEDTKDFQKLQQFSKGYYVLRKGADDNLIMSDLRFGSLGNTSVSGVLGGGLNFTLKTTDFGNLVVERAHPDRNVTRENIKQYFKRIAR